MPHAESSHGTVTFPEHRVGPGAILGQPARPWSGGGMAPAIDGHGVAGVISGPDRTISSDLIRLAMPPREAGYLLLLILAVAVSTLAGSGLWVLLQLVAGW